jgi:hypothetical protein
MGRYDYNTTSIVVPPGTMISSLAYNSGQMKVGADSEIRKCSYNSGNLQIAENSFIDTIGNNSANIFIGNNCKVNTIKYNSGNIRLGSNCKVENLRYNSGVIEAGPQSILPKGKYNSGTIRVLGGPGITPVLTPPSADPDERQKKIDLFSKKYTTPTPPAPVPVTEPVTVGCAFAPSAPPITQLSTSPTASAPVMKKRRAPVPPALSPGEKTEQSADDLEKGFCTICMENPRTIAFNCGHLSCENCSVALTLCHMCRVPIGQKIKLFL